MKYQVLIICILFLVGCAANNSLQKLAQDKGTDQDVDDFAANDTVLEFPAQNIYLHSSVGNHIKIEIPIFDGPNGSLECANGSIVRTAEDCKIPAPTRLFLDKITSNTNYELKDITYVECASSKKTDDPNNCLANEEFKLRCRHASEITFSAESSIELSEFTDICVDEWLKYYLKTGKESIVIEGLSNDKPQILAKTAPKEPEYTLGDEVVAGNFKWKFTKYETTDQIGEEIYDTFMGVKADGEFLIIDVEVENIGKSASYLLASYVKLVDAEGREFSADSTAGFYLKPQGSALSFDLVNPGIVKKGKLVFDVPPGLKVVDIRVSSSLLADSFYNIKLIT